MNLFRRLPPLALALSALLASNAALAAPSANLKFCVFDIVGASGDAFSMSKDYVVAMQRYGVNIDLKAYNDEAEAEENFRNGQCDAMIVTGIRMRPYNKVTGSMEAIGATTIIRNGKIDMASTYEVVRTLAQTFAATSPMVSKLMVNGNYEVGGILPIGAVYPIVSDRRINTLEALAGKRIAVIDNDPAEAVLVKRIGGIPVPCNYNNLVPKFIAGQMDMIVSPALAYKPLNIQKAVGTAGGLARFPVAMMSYQMVFNRTKFPENFGDTSRKYWLTQFDRVMQLIKQAEAGLPLSVIVELSPENTLKYTLMLREARIDIAQQGIYDKRALKIFKRVRCSVNPSDPECSTKSEEEWK
jgi:Family of unknown function (DUF6091)